MLQKGKCGWQETLWKGLYMSVGQRLQIHGAWDKLNYRQLLWPAPEWLQWDMRSPGFHRPHHSTLRSARCSLTSG